MYVNWFQNYVHFFLLLLPNATIKYQQQQQEKANNSKNFKLTCSNYAGIPGVCSESAAVAAGESLNFTSQMCLHTHKQTKRNKTNYHQSMSFV